MSYVSLENCTIRRNENWGITFSESSHIDFSGDISISSNAILGIFVGHGSTAIVHPETNLTVSENGLGIVIAYNSHLVTTEDTNLLIINNDIGIISLTNSPLVLNMTLVENNGIGIFLIDSSLGMGDESVVQNNAVFGILSQNSTLDASGLLVQNNGIGVHVEDGGSAHISNSQVTRINASFGSRLTLNENTIDALCYDSTVLCRSDTGDCDVGCP